ncbi:hypothetical protein FQN55_003866 [Onygenales sp. PD_40]|nr:hypothetical protein FQN55_003866 [Onygenales sp. PD_40]
MEPKEDSFWMGIYIGKGSKKVTVEAQFDDTSPYNLIAQKWVKGMDIQSAKPGDDYDKAVPDALGQRYQVLGCVKLQYFQHTGAKSFHDYFYVVNERPPESADSLVGTGSGLWKSYRDSHVHDAHPVSLAKVTPGLQHPARFPSPTPVLVSGFSTGKDAG